MVRMSRVSVGRLVRDGMGRGGSVVPVVALFLVESVVLLVQVLQVVSVVVNLSKAEGGKAVRYGISSAWVGSMSFDPIHDCGSGG